MDGLERTVLARLPLAEAVLLVWRWLAEPGWLRMLFASFRRRSYERLLTFDLFVRLIADALLQHDGSGRQSFERAIESGSLGCSIQGGWPCDARGAMPTQPARTGSRP